MLISTASNAILFSIHGVGGGMCVNMKTAFVKVKTQNNLRNDAFKTRLFVEWCQVGEFKFARCNPCTVHDIIYGPGERENIVQSTQKNAESLQSNEKNIQSERRESMRLVTHLSARLCVMCLRQEVGLSFVLHCFRLLFPAKEIQSRLLFRCCLSFFPTLVSAHDYQRSFGAN